MFKRKSYVFAAFSPIYKREKYGLSIFWSVVVMLVVNINLLPSLNLRNVVFLLFIRRKLVFQTKSTYFCYVVLPLYITTLFSLIYSLHYWHAIRVTFHIRVAKPVLIRVFSNVFFALLHTSFALPFAYCRDIQYLLLQCFAKTYNIAQN
jgi:hypothetical protein